MILVRDETFSGPRWQHFEMSESESSRMEHGRVGRLLPDWNSLRLCRFVEASSGQQVSTARPFLNLPVFSCPFQVRELLSGDRVLGFLGFLGFLLFFVLGCQGKGERLEAGM